ncbi:hypothetical protein BDZ45DRAFT_215232 [Acephala macrosclerotiorum]|nr:hypothetical protein BDZ45DRAFT_215232 [Acephala macrosclerotiorum]
MEPFSKEGVHCDRLVYPREILIDQEMDLRIRFLFVFGISGSLCNLNSHSHQLQFFSFRVTDFQTMSLHRSVPHSAFFTYCSRQNLQSGHVPRMASSKNLLHTLVLFSSMQERRAQHTLPSSLPPSLLHPSHITPSPNQQVLSMAFYLRFVASLCTLMSSCGDLCAFLAVTPSDAA